MSLNTAKVAYDHLINGNEGKKEVPALSLVPKAGGFNSTLSSRNPLLGYDDKIYKTSTYSSLYDPTLNNQVISCRNDLRVNVGKMPGKKQPLRPRDIGSYTSAKYPTHITANSSFVTLPNPLGVPKVR